MKIKQADLRNHLLSRLSVRDFAELAPHLEEVELPSRRQLEIRGRAVERNYFPESGLASVIAQAAKGQLVETGIIGREGFTGIGVERCTQSIVIQIAGHGYAAPAAIVRRLTDESPTFRMAKLRFARAFTVQAAQTALANGCGRLEQRLARWLLMLHDRVDGERLAITHDYIAIMLAVRRPGVSVALKQLEAEGLIENERGVILIRNRAGLRLKCDGLYGATEQEYQRLIGWKPQHG